MATENHRDALVEIAVEGFGKKFIAPYFLYPFHDSSFR